MKNFNLNYIFKSPAGQTFVKTSSCTQGLQLLLTKDGQNPTIVPCVAHYNQDVIFLKKYEATKAESRYA